MLIAITQHAGDVNDEDICEKYNHKSKTVETVIPIKNEKTHNEFIKAANNCAFDAIFFPSAFSAEKIGPEINPHLATKVRMIANGPQTAKKLHNIGLAAEMLPFFYSRDLIPYLGKWIHGKRIGIPRADVTYPKLSDEIKEAGGIPCEYKCYELIPSNTEVDLTGCGAIIFTSPAAYKLAKLPPISNDVILAAIGEVTADAMMYGGHMPSIVGDGSIEGTIKALNASLWTENY